MINLTKNHAQGSGNRQIRIRTGPYKFSPIDEEWQRNACHTMELEFVSRCDLDEGGPNVPLTRPRRVKSILGDVNCLFRSFSYVLNDNMHKCMRPFSATYGTLNTG